MKCTFDIYLLEKQFCQISSWSSLKRRSPGLFWRGHRNKEKRSDMRSVPDLKSCIQLKKSSSMCCMSLSLSALLSTRLYSLGDGQQYICIVFAFLTCVDTLWFALRSWLHEDCFGPQNSRRRTFLKCCRKYSTISSSSSSSSSSSPPNYKIWLTCFLYLCTKNMEFPNPLAVCNLK